MDHFPTVSVIIPNYNHAAYLVQRIETVIHQTFNDLEIILLDDCSTHNSREIIERYRGHPLVKSVIYNSENTGSPFVQWKRGLELAKGKWIWIAESDDYANHTFLETMLSTFSTDKNVGLIFCDSHIVIDHCVSNETFSSQRKARLGLVHWDRSYRNLGILELNDYVFPYGAINNTSAVLFNREILLNANAFDIPFRFMGDKYAFAKVLALSDIGYVHAPLNYYRASIDSKPKHTNEYLDYFREHFLIFNWATRNLKSINKKKLNQAVKLNCEFALFTGWRVKKVKLIWELGKLNSTLLLKILWFNFIRSIVKIFPRA